VLVVKTGVFTALMLLAVLSTAQKTPIQRAPKFKWGEGLPQELNKTLVDYKDISSGDRAALLHAFAHESNDFPTPPSPMDRAEQTLVRFADLNGDGT